MAETSANPIMHYPFSCTQNPDFVVTFYLRERNKVAERITKETSTYMSTILSYIMLHHLDFIQL